MNNILVPPLQIKHDQIEPTILKVVRKIHDAAGKHNTPYFLAGAAAREVILHHVFGRPPHQIAVRAAAEHLERCEMLVTKFGDALLSAP